MNQEDYQHSIDYAFRILAKKRYTIGEMKEKIRKFLKRTGCEADEIDQGKLIEKVIGRLQELRYLDDEQYAKDFISTRTKIRPKGEFALKQELYKKGLDKELIDQSLRSADLDEVEIGSELLERKGKRWESEPAIKQKEKAMRFLAARGFRPDAIYKIINTYYNRIS